MADDFVNWTDSEGNRAEVMLVDPEFFGHSRPCLEVYFGGILEDDYSEDSMP